MARKVNPKEHASKRREILDAAQRLVFTKGYEQMSIKNVLDEVQISSGAFHHYFDSRAALLEALIENMQRQVVKPVLAFIQDPDLTAIEKLQGFFDLLDSMRLASRADLVRLMRVWYMDDNALVRQKIDEAVFEQRAPLMAEIVRQGIQEGAFHTSHPGKAGEVILSLLWGMGNTHSRLLLTLDREIGGATDRRVQSLIAEIVATHAAYMDAIERLLGLPANSLHRTDAEAVNVWIEALRAE
jgi:AcrR family transcriptional regulator